MNILMDGCVHEAAERNASEVDKWRSRCIRAMYERNKSNWKDQ